MIVLDSNLCLENNSYTELTTFLFAKVSRNLPCIKQGRSVYDCVRNLICSIMVTVLPGHRRQVNQGVAQIRIQN